MELVQKVDCKVQVRAVLDDEGNFKLQVSSSAPYGKRTASASVEDIPVEEADKVKAAMDAVLKSTGLLAARKAVVVANQAERIAFERGESI